MLLNTRRFFVTSFCVLWLVALGFDLKAQVSVVKRASEFAGNPTLDFKGVTGDATVSTAIGSNFSNCGWFDVVKGRADYMVSGSSVGGVLTISVMDSGSRSFSLSVQYQANNSRATANMVVDSILKRIFSDSKLQGICSSKIAFCVQTQKGVKEIYIADFDGQNVVAVTDSNTLSVEPDWVPGKMNLVYTKYGRSFTDVVETDLLTKKSRGLARYPGLNSGGAVSPDGSTIALSLSRDGQVELYTKPIGKSGQKRLTNSTSVEASPCWSPDGRMICYVSNKGGTPKLYITGADGRGAQAVAIKGVEAVSPDWNALNQIAYASRVGSTYKIAVTDMSKGTSKIINNDGGDWESPSWAPDNRHIICSRTLGGKSSLVVIDSWSGRYKQFVSSPNNLTLPSWSKFY